MAAFRGMHVSPAKHSFGKCDRRTDRQKYRQTDRWTTDKVILMCRYALQATQKQCMFWNTMPLAATKSEETISSTKIKFIETWSHLKEHHYWCTLAKYQVSTSAVQSYCQGKIILRQSHRQIGKNNKMTKNSIQRAKLIILLLCTRFVWKQSWGM